MDIVKETRRGLTLRPNMWLKLVIADREQATRDDLARICQGIESRGYNVKVIPDQNQPQAIVVER